MVGVLAVVPAASAARQAYVTNSGDGTVSVLDAVGNGFLTSTSVGGEPVDVAVMPDGTHAYVANKGSNSVDVIDTATNARVAAIAVGKEPTGIAITPNGAGAYVSNFGDGTVSVIGTGVNTVLVPPIAVGKEPDGVAVSTDGSRVFVAQRSGGIAVISTASNAVVETIPAPLGPSRLAIVPQGERGFVTDAGGTSVTAFNPMTGALVGSPIQIGQGAPAGIAVGPDSGVATVAIPSLGSVTPVDASLGTVLSNPIGGFPGATGVAIKPKGDAGYVTDAAGSSVTVFNTETHGPLGQVGVGAKPTAVAVMPNQGPRASFWVSPSHKRARTKLTFHGAGSTDPDGKVVQFAWDFGDGQQLIGPQNTRSHRYRRPGTYQVTLAVTDDEGCANQLVFNGQTVLCNGSSAAIFTSLVEVGDTTGPILRLGGAKHQGIGRRVGVRARCPREACSLRAGGVVVTAIERGGKVARRQVRIGKAAAQSYTRGWRKLRPSLPRRARQAARQALLSGGTAKAKVAVTARDEQGEQTLRVRTVELSL